MPALTNIQTSPTPPVSTSTTEHSSNQLFSKIFGSSFVSSSSVSNPSTTSDIVKLYSGPEDINNSKMDNLKLNSMAPLEIEESDETVPIFQLKTTTSDRSKFNSGQKDINNSKMDNLKLNSMAPLEIEESDETALSYKIMRTESKESNPLIEETQNIFKRHDVEIHPTTSDVMTTLSKFSSASDKGLFSNFTDELKNTNKSEHPELIKEFLSELKNNFDPEGNLPAMLDEPQIDFLLKGEGSKVDNQVSKQYNNSFDVLNNFDKGQLKTFNKNMSYAKNGNEGLNRILSKGNAINEVYVKSVLLGQNESVSLLNTFLDSATSPDKANVLRNTALDSTLYKLIDKNFADLGDTTKNNNYINNELGDMIELVANTLAISSNEAKEMVTTHFNEIMKLFY